MEGLMEGCVFAGGVLKDAEAARQVARRCDLIIAADGGAKHAAALGLRPHVIVGDMDSADRTLLQDSKEAELIVWPQEKDKTDTELGVELAFKRGCGEVTLLAAVGDRLDHTLGNVMLVAKHPGRVEILDGRATLAAVGPSKEYRVHGEIGTIVSLIPYGSLVEKVKSTGLKYPLTGSDLTLGTRGMSNEIRQSEASVSVNRGILLVYVEPAIGKRNSA